MTMPISDAKTQITDLPRHAKSRDEVVLTRHGQPTERPVPVKVVADRATRRAILKAAHASGMAKALVGLSAARSEDDLYGEDGLPV